MNRYHALNDCMTRLQHIQSRIGTPQEKSGDERLAALLSHQIAQQLHRRATESHHQLQRKMLANSSLTETMNPRPAQPVITE